MPRTFKKLNVINTTTDFRESVKIVEVRLLKPKEDEILVRNIYVGVNATDVIYTTGAHNSDQNVPFDIGHEALGVVEALGKNITQYKVGQSVFVLINRIKPRAYAEYVYATLDEIIPVPYIKPEFLALLVCGLTASIGLSERAHIKRGEKVLITAPAGGTGHICVQIARQRGCHVIGMTSSEEKAKLLRVLGCDRVINYKTEDVDKVLTNEYPSGIGVIWETIGGQVFETLFKHLAPKGRFMTIGGTSGYKTDGIPEVNIPNLPTTLLMGNKSLIGFLIFGFKELYEKHLNQLIEDVVNGKLKIHLDFGLNTSDGQFIGIESIVRGIEHLQSGRSIGKILIKIQNI